MTTDPSHVPTPEFRAQLEWEITRAFRRESRLGEARRLQGRRWMRAAGVIITCIGIGTTSGIAWGQVRDLTRRDSLLDGARADLMLAKLRMDLAKATFDDLARKMRAGAIDAVTAAPAEDDFRSLEARTAKAQLNIDEIQASSQAPRDELTAPLVGARDFVTERIRLDLSVAQQKLMTAERAASLAAARVRAGAASDITRAEAETDVVRAQADLTVLAERLSLRREFLDKRTSAADLATRLESAQLRQDVVVARQALSLAQARASLAERQRAAGATTDIDVMRAQLAVKERELDLSQLALRLKKTTGGATPEAGT